MGAACDIPAHTYQFSFCDNSQWSQFYAGQAEIYRYINRVVDDYDVRKHIQTKHTVTKAVWDERVSKWNLSVEDGRTGETFTDVADFVYYGPGLLSNPRWPSIPGREKYTGIIHHSGSWDAAAEEAAGMDWSNKRVGVIGVGSSAIQIVPEMQGKCKSLISFARSKSE
jgi:cation diffusion facilitator CzcD-associated flavoprotein CzcO